MSVHITPRNRAFRINPESVRNSVRNDPVPAAFYAALSATFPDGERFFVQSVRRYAHGLEERLSADVAAFVQQEGHHAREHVAFNQQARDGGLPMELLVERAQRQLAIVARRAPINCLAMTAALEHFTAVFANRLLANASHLDFADDVTRALWRWHAVEEVEHKSVAYDVFLVVTKDWAALRRYVCRTSAFLEAMTRLAFVVWCNVRDTLAADGKAKGTWGIGFLRFLFVSPGIVSAMSGDLVRFFAPGFHPCHCDDRAILAEAIAELAPAA